MNKLILITLIIMLNVAQTFSSPYIESLYRRALNGNDEKKGNNPGQSPISNRQDQTRSHNHSRIRRSNRLPEHQSEQETRPLLSPSHTTTQNKPRLMSVIGKVKMSKDVDQKRFDNGKGRKANDHEAGTSRRRWFSSSSASSFKQKGKAIIKDEVRSSGSKAYAVGKNCYKKGKQAIKNVRETCEGAYDGLQKQIKSLKKSEKSNCDKSDSNGSEIRHLSRSCRWDKMVLHPNHRLHPVNSQEFDHETSWRATYTHRPEPDWSNSSFEALDGIPHEYTTSDSDSDGSVNKSSPSHNVNSEHSRSP